MFDFQLVCRHNIHARSVPSLFSLFLQFFLSQPVTAYSSCPLPPTPDLRSETKPRQDGQRPNAVRRSVHRNRNGHPRPQPCPAFRRFFRPACAVVVRCLQRPTLGPATAMLRYTTEADEAVRCVNAWTHRATIVLFEILLWKQRWCRHASEYAAMFRCMHMSVCVADPKVNIEH